MDSVGVQEVHMLYTMVVIPTITYVPLVWSHKNKSKAGIYRLDKLQKLAPLRITWPLTITPRVTMKLLLNAIELATYSI